MNGYRQKGEITVFLSLVFLLLLSFAGGMIESASIQVLKSNRKAEMSLALESVFAEYQNELLEKYDIFALDTSYGTGEYDENNVKRRLTYYGAREDESEVQKSRILTDMSGRPFYEQAVRYMENKIGIDGIGNDRMDSDSWKDQEENAENYQEEESEVENSLDSMLGEAEESLPDENNPIQSIAEIQKSNLLQIVVPDAEQLSNKQIRKENLASVRTLKKGKGDLPFREEPNEVTGKLFLNEYLTEHFLSYGKTEEGHVLDYELEYLIGRKESDRENLEIVVKKILGIRFALNYAYLLTDEQKKMEAEVLALTMCTLLTVPGITEVVKHALLLAWAYGEGIVDLRTLMKGEKVPVVKNAENWNLQLSALLQLGETGEGESGTTAEDGMDYAEYLKGLLLLEKKEVLSMHALDLIEGNLNIKADSCVTELEIKSRCTLRRNIQYQFTTYFGYQ